MEQIKRYKIMSGSSLKVLAMVTMLIDHTASYVLRYIPAFTEPLINMGHHYITWYFLLRCVGRLAFPLFAFLLVEGFIHTHNRRKYGRNILVFAFISVIPWNLTHGGHLYGFSLNVMFTLFLGFLALCLAERWEQQKGSPRLAIMLLGIIVGAAFLRMDYGTSGVSFILLLYVLRRQPLMRAAIGCCFLSARLIAGLAFIPITMYNGQRGFIHGPVSKYLFYAFYPSHLLLLYIVQQFLGLR